MGLLWKSRQLDFMCVRMCACVCVCGLDMEYEGESQEKRVTHGWWLEG